MNQDKKNNCFKDLAGNTFDSPSQIKKILSPYLNDFQIHVGCDSQEKGSYVDFNVSLIFYSSKNGCKIFNFRERHSFFKNRFLRLWQEVTKSLEIANLLNCHCTIHLDLSENEKQFSNALTASGKGYIESYGYTVVTKPDAWAASKVADIFCRD